MTTTEHYPTRLKFKFLQTLELHCQWVAFMLI